MLGHHVSLEMRNDMIKWLEMVVKEFDLSIDTFFRAILLIDTYLQKSALDGD